MTTQHTPTDCKEWEGKRDEDGYGRKSHAGKWMGAHRLAWETEVGPIPTGLVIDHLCRNRACVNVSHMEVVTPAENTLRGDNPPAQNARKLACEVGHPFSGNNLHIDRRGHRQCRECGRKRWRSYRRRKIAEGTWTRT